MAGEKEWERVLYIPGIRGRAPVISDHWSVSDGHRATMATAGRDWWVYPLAAVCGIATGWADVIVDDLLFTALLVLAACMVLGMLRPRWPWRWVLTVGAFIPLTELAAYLIRAVKPTPAQIYGSFLAFFPGIAGAYGGAVMRRVIENLRQGK